MQTDDDEKADVLAEVQTPGKTHTCLVVNPDGSVTYTAVKVELQYEQVPLLPSVGVGDWRLRQAFAQLDHHLKTGTADASGQSERQHLAEGPGHLTGHIQGRVPHGELPTAGNMTEPPQAVDLTGGNMAVLQQAGAALRADDIIVQRCDQADEELRNRFQKLDELYRMT